MPPYIAVPSFGTKISGRGFLSAATAPFSVGGNPDKDDFKVRDLDFYQGLDLQRLDRRRQLVDAIDQFSRQKDAGVQLDDPDLERAYNLIASEEAKRAFKLSEGIQRDASTIRSWRWQRYWTKLLVGEAIGRTRRAVRYGQQPRMGHTPKHRLLKGSISR